jgi:signal transduction histidine kinase
MTSSAPDYSHPPSPIAIPDRTIPDRTIPIQRIWLTLDPDQESIISIEASIDSPLRDLPLPIAFDRLFTPTTRDQLRPLLAETRGLYPLTIPLQGQTWGAWLHWDNQRCRLELEPLGEPIPITTLAEELAAIAPLKQATSNPEFWSIVHTRLQAITGAQVQIQPSRSDYGPGIGGLDPKDQNFPDRLVVTIGSDDPPWARAITDRPVSQFSYQQRVFLSLWADWVGLEFAHHLNRQRQDQIEAIRCANEDLARSNRELESFAYAASHDLKEPLRGIHNYSTFLLEDYADVLDDAGIDRLQTLLRLSNRMEALIDALLQFARLGQVPLTLSDVALQDLVEWVIKLIHMSRPESPFEIHIAQPLPIVHCDRVLITEVFTNLISNALKYNDQPPQIEIGYQSTPSNSSTGDRVFYVRDNGIGIRDRHLNQIFRLFKRLHPQKRYGGGTGAGLTIARKIIERHGGQIWVESEWGQGSTFYFRLGGKLGADSPMPQSV